MPKLAARLQRVFFVVAIGLPMAALPVVSSASDPVLSKKESAAFRATLKYADRSDYGRYRRHFKSLKDPLALKIATWVRLSKGGMFVGNVIWNRADNVFGHLDVFGKSSVTAVVVAGCLRSTRASRQDRSRRPGPRRRLR